jgi:Sec-independent protein translocase protein TatA
LFGISIYEFLVIVLVAVLVIPARHWGDVAKFVASIVKFVRNLIWKISDMSEVIKDKIDREVPIDKLIKSTTDDVIGAFSDVMPKKRKTGKKITVDSPPTR